MQSQERRKHTGYYARTDPKQLDKIQSLKKYGKEGGGQSSEK